MYRGVIVPLVTPVTAAGEVCRASVEGLVDSVRPVATALMPALSSGEGWRLTARQWHDMVLHTRRCARGLPVLAGIALPTTAGVIERAALARALEVDALVVPPPFGAALPQGEIRGHYRAIRWATGQPLFLYNAPQLSGTAMTLETMVALSRDETAGVVGIKDSGSVPAETRALVAAATGVPIFQGWEPLCQATTPGVHGYILPLSNLEPALCRSMLESPSPHWQAEIDRQCAQHDLLGDEWYLGIKRELQRRGVIGEARPA
jgi:4-hydroxy-tetrahydrodipicolinate synthase